MRKDAREGEQYLNTYCLSRKTPVLANKSKLGVINAGLRNPTSE